MEDLETQIVLILDSLMRVFMHLKKKDFEEAIKKLETTYIA